MKKILFLFILFYGCITTPQFINDKIDEKNKPIVEKTQAQKEAIRLNNEAVNIVAYNLSDKDSIFKGIELLEKAIALDSTSRIAFSHYVHYIYLSGDTTRALSESRRMVDIFVDDPHAWMLRGILLSGEDLESVEAVECFKRSKDIFESRGDEVNSMFSSFMAGENESNESDFKSKFKEALKKSNLEQFSSMVDDLDRENIIRQYKRWDCFL